MTFQPKIQAFQSAHVAESGSNVQCAIDYVAGSAYMIGGPAGPTTYIDKFDLFSGNELAFQPDSAYSPATPFHEFPIGVDSNGVLFVGANPNFNVAIQAHSADLTQIAQGTIAFNFAMPQGSFSPITNTSGDKYMLVTGIGGTSGSLEIFGCINTANLTLWVPGVISYSNRLAVSCAGMPNTGIGWVISSPEASDTGGDLILIQVNTNRGLQGSTVIATILFSAIDAGWTTVQQNGICIDQTDGNLLVFCQGQLGATNPYYLIKINSVTGAVIWKLAIPGIGGGVQVAQSLIKSQQYGLIYGTGGGNSDVAVINTASGTISSTVTLTGIIPFASQSYNDQLGAVFGEFGFSGGGASPIIPLNSTPTPFTGWGLLYAVPAVAGVAPPPGGGSPTISPRPVPPGPPVFNGPPWNNVPSPFSMALVGADEICKPPH